jgi:hypothetical protein
MKIRELLNNVSKLVSERDIIDHGSIRCLYSETAAREILSMERHEEEEEIGTGTIGDDELSSDIAELAEDGDRVLDLDFDALKSLEYEYRGEDIRDYLEEEREDEFRNLDRLIDAARNLI